MISKQTGCVLLPDTRTHRLMVYSRRLQPNEGMHVCRKFRSTKLLLDCPASLYCF